MQEGALDGALPLADTAELRAALDEANIQTLLASYCHLTQDSAYLDRFAPHIRPAMAGGTSIPDDLAADLRTRMHALLTRGEGLASGVAPDALIQRIMSITSGEPVEDEFLPLVYDQCGFKPWIDRTAITERKRPGGAFKVLVIGAGMTGVAAAIKLTEAGYDYVVIEKNPEVGGTWWENRYPGVGVDTPSHFYSYSWKIWTDWHDYHPRGADMQRYMVEAAKDANIHDHVRFETTVDTLVYNEADGTWTVTVRKADGTTEDIVANAVINGHGPVNRFKWPEIEGLKEFNGTLIHTANWPADLDIRGKRVAIIGTGASSAQLVGAIAPDAAAITVFQRSKHWVIHNPENADVVSEGMKWALTHIPTFKEWFRFRVYWSAADGLYENVVMDPAYAGRDDAVSAHNAAAREWALGHLRRKFAHRPDLVEKLTPDFPLFSKRIILDNGWLDALLQDNVHLEDKAIARVLPGGIETVDGRVFEADVIVCATGFNVSKMLGNLTVKGIGGRDLGEEWGDDNPHSYMGMCIPGYPNYFHTVGPNSAPNHAAGQNLVSECQVNWIIEAIDRVVAADAKSFEVTQDAFDAWNDKVQTRMQRMIWSHPKSKSYYKNSAGRNFMSWPWRLVDFFNETRKPEDGSYILHR